MIFQEKCFSCYSPLTDQICQQGREVIKFEIILIFLIKPFQHITKRSRKKFKYLENKKSF